MCPRPSSRACDGECMEIAAISVMLHVAMSSTRNRHINSKSEKKKVLCKTYHKMPVRESSGYSSRIPLCHHLTFSSYRVSRKALKTAHQLNLSGFAGSVTDGVVRLALGRVTSENLRAVNLSGCHSRRLT